MENKQLPLFDLEKIKENISVYIGRKGIPIIYTHNPVTEDVLVEFEFPNYRRYEPRRVIHSNIPDIARVFFGHNLRLTDLINYGLYSKTWLRFLIKNDAPEKFKRFLERGTPSELDSEENATYQPSLANFLAINACADYGRQSIKDKSLREFNNLFFSPIESLISSIPPELRRSDYQFNEKTGLDIFPGKKQ